MIVDIATLNVGDKCLDFAGWSDYAEMARLGVDCAARYVDTGLASSSWKVTSRAQIAKFHSLGIGFLSLWEASNLDPLKGYAKGVAHGQRAALSNEQLGYPYGLPCIAAVDFDATTANMTACAEYMRGFQTGLAGKYVCGVYGDIDIIKRCAFDGTAEVFHYAGASSWSHHEWLDIVHLRQSIVGGVSGAYDNNYVLRPVQMWLPHYESDPIPVPPQQEYDMSTLIALDEPARFYDSRDPQSPNRLRAGVKRDIDTGHPEATLATFHCEVVNAAPGNVVFWKGLTPAPGVTSVGVPGGSSYGQATVSAPVTNGHVTVQSLMDCDLVCDLVWYLT